MQPRHRWAERFQHFTARKARLAATAPLPPYVTDLDDPEPDAIAIGNAWSKHLFDGSFYIAPRPGGNRPACSLVFVQSSDGNTVAADPGTLGGGETDKHLIYEGLSRVAADGVLAGAGTVRRSEVVFSIWHPELVDLRASLGFPRHPVQIVATLRGLDLEDALLFNVPEISVLLLTAPSAARQMRDALAARPWVTPVPMAGPHDLPSTFERLYSMGIQRISCIGGRTLAHHLLEARLIDDVYLTTGNERGGEPGTPLFQAPWPHRLAVRKRGTGIERGVRFDRLIADGNPSER
jgi:riboflavin biosynthesis pyrimidine reductase